MKKWLFAGDTTMARCGLQKKRRIFNQTLLIMKLTVMLLITAVLGVQANGLSQTITLSGKDVKLRQVFTAIEKQTGYVVIYNRDHLENSRPVSFSVTNMPLTDFLDLILKDRPSGYRLEGRTISLSRKPAITPDIPLSIDIKGRIINEKGEPVIASISVKGTNKGSASDTSGYFTLKNIDENAILVITGISIEPMEVKLAGRKELNIIVKTKAKGLDDVVVTTGYGLEKRTKELGYAVAKITKEELMRTSPGNIFTGLTGKVSGMVISNQGTGMDADNSVLLRGVRSINSTANNQPLIILNGSPLSFGTDQNAASMAIDFVNNLNPNDIEDITVLKGANGSAIYGPEGVNGVIIINTKKGAGKQLGVNFRISSNFQRINWKQRKIQEIFGTGDLTDDNGNPVYNPHGDELWGPAYDGQMVPLGRPDENGEVQMVPYKYSNDRQKFWDVARNTQYNLSFSQSDAHSDFYLGINYTAQAGLLPKDRQYKAGILLNTGRTINKLSVRANIAYNYTSSDKGPSSIATDNIPPHVPLLSYKDYINYKWADRNHYYSDQSPNPYETVDNIRSNGTENALTGSIELKLKPFPWLVVTERPGISFSSVYLKSTNKPLNYSDYAKELGANGRWISYQDMRAQMQEKNLGLLTLNNDLLVSTTHKVGDFLIKATLGNTVRQSFIKDLRGSAQLIIPVYNLQFGRLNETYPSERSELSRFYSFFGTAMVGYKDKIFVEFTGRNDRDSKLAAVARNKNFYAGINTSIVMKELIPALQNITWLSNFRLRASLTGTANMNIKPYQSERLLRFEGFRYEDLIGYNYMKNIPNPLLEPENVFSQEYGGVLSFFDNRISLDIARYRQRNNGLILDVVNSIYSGAPTTDNAGIYDNWGWEFDLNIKQLFKSAGAFSASTRLMLAINDNKVVELPAVYGGRLTAVINNTITVAARTGNHAFEFFNYGWKKDPQGRVIVDPFTGIPEMDYGNPIFSGRTLPKYTASASLQFQWKRWSLSGLVEYRGGNEQFNDKGSLGMRMGQSLLTLYNDRKPFVYPNSVYDDGQGKYLENRDIKISSLRDYYMQASWVSSNFLINAGFFTLREIALSYDFNIKQKYIRQISAGIYGRDLLTVYAKNNIYGDPQLIRGPGTERDRGLDPNYSSNSKSFGSVAADQDRLPGIIQYGFFVNLGL